MWKLVWPGGRGTCRRQGLQVCHLPFAIGTWGLEEADDGNEMAAGLRAKQFLWHVVAPVAADLLPLIPHGLSFGLGEWAVLGWYCPLFRRLFGPKRYNCLVCECQPAKPQPTHKSQVNHMVCTRSLLIYCPKPYGIETYK